MTNLSTLSTPPSANVDICRPRGAQSGSTGPRVCWVSRFGGRVSRDLSTLSYRAHEHRYFRSLSSISFAHFPAWECPARAIRHWRQTRRASRSASAALLAFRPALEREGRRARRPRG